MRAPALAAPAHPGAAPPDHEPAKSLPVAKNLTLTGLYNVLQALREGRALSAKEKTIHQQGLVGVLKTLHDELDAAVLRAYGWSDLLPLAASLSTSEQNREQLLTRLVALNAQRAVEEANGMIRWLRPEFQNPEKSLSKQELPAQVQQALDVDFPYEKQSQKDSNNEAATASAAATQSARAAIQAWPATLPEQVRAVAQVLSQASGPLKLAEIEARFKGRGGWKKSLPTLLQTLEAMGRAQHLDVIGDVAWRA